MVSAIAKVRNNGEHEHTVRGKFNQGDGPGKKLKFFRCLADTVIQTTSDIAWKSVTSSHFNFD